MEKATSLLYKIAVIAAYLIAIVLSVKVLHEPDTFWQLATGEWILTNHSVPQTDIFSYTFANQNWVNIKWGYEVIIALITHVFSIEFIPLFQAVLLIILTWLLLRLTFIPLNHVWQRLLSLLVIYVVLAASSYRFTGRPEVISHVFAIAFVYIIHQSNSNKKLLYLLPLLQIVWTNTHEAFGLGLVICIVYTAAAWLQWFWLKNKSATNKPIVITLITLLCTVAVAINPYGVTMLAKPFNIFGQLDSNKFTYELANYKQYYYWQTSTYVTLALLCITILGMIVFFIRLPKNKKVETLLQNIPLGHLLMLLAMVWLAKDAYRNVVFLNLILTPFITFALVQLLTPAFDKFNQTKLNIAIGAVCVFVALILYISIVQNGLYRFLKTNDKYGLALPSEQNPVDVATFLAKYNLQKQVLYTDYISSSYLIYKLQPHYKSFVDLRDLDVFPDSFIYRNAEIHSNYGSFKTAENNYKFYGAVVLNTQFENLLNGLYNDSTYYLAYFDPLMSVFLKTTFLNKIPKAAAITNHSIANSGFVANTICKLFNPFYKPSIINTLENAEELYFANNVGDINKAMYLIKQKQPLQQNYNINQLVIAGQYYYKKAITDTVNTIAFLDSAEYVLTSALNKNNKLLNANYYMGLICYGRGYYLKASTYFDQCCNTNPEYTYARMYLSECYKSLIDNGGKKEYLKLLVSHLETLYQQIPENPDVIWNLGMAYFKNKQYSKAQPLLEKSLLYDDYLSEADIVQAKQALQTCKTK